MAGTKRTGLASAGFIRSNAQPLYFPPLRIKFMASLDDITPEQDIFYLVYLKKSNIFLKNLDFSAYPLVSERTEIF